MAESSAVAQGNPFQQNRPLTEERAQLYARSAETLAERYEEELARWLGEATVRAEPASQILIPDLAVADTDLTIVRTRYHLTHALIATDLQLALTLASMLCGGSGGAVTELRPLTRLEMGVVDLVLGPLMTLVAEEFDIGPVELGSHVTNASALPDGKPEHAIVIPLQVAAGAVKGRIRVGLTQGQLQGYNEELDRRIAGRMTATHHTINIRAARAVRPVPVEVIVGFEPMHVPAGHLADLQVGDVLRTRQSLSRHLVARVGSERIFHVRAAQRGQRLVAELIARIETDKGAR